MGPTGKELGQTDGEPLNGDHILGGSGLLDWFVSQDVVKPLPLWRVEGSRTLLHEFCGHGMD